MTYITKALSALNAASRATYFGGAMRTWLNRRPPIGTVLSVFALRQYISKMDGERILAIAVFSDQPSAKSAVYSLVSSGGACLWVARMSAKL